MNNQNTYSSRRTALIDESLSTVIKVTEATDNFHAHAVAFTRHKHLRSHRDQGAVESQMSSRKVPRRQRHRSNPNLLQSSPR